MAVKSTTGGFSVTLKVGDRDIDLGIFKSRDYADTVYEIAGLCVTGDGTCGFIPEVIKIARRMGIIPKLERALRIAISEEVANANVRKTMERVHANAVKSVMPKEKQSDLYKSIRFKVKALTKVKTEYPEIPTNRVLVSEAIEQSLLPTCSGVYFIWCNGEIAYVGMSINIRSRVNPATHEKVFAEDEVSWLGFSPKTVRFAECFYIGLATPHRNFVSTDSIKAIFTS